MDSRGSLYEHERTQFAAQAFALGQSTICVISGWIAGYDVSVVPPIFTYDSTLYFGISAKLFDLKIAPQRTLHWHLINDAIKTTITASPRPARGKRFFQGTSNHPLYIITYYSQSFSNYLTSKNGSSSPNKHLGRLLPRA